MRAGRAVVEWGSARLDLGEARLADVRFQGAKIRATRFDGCDLGRADLTKAELDNVDARGSTLNLAGSVLGLRGLKVDCSQLIDLLPAPAAEIGIEIADRG